MKALRDGVSIRDIRKDNGAVTFTVVEMVDELDAETGSVSYWPSSTEYSTYVGGDGLRVRNGSDWVQVAGDFRFLINAGTVDGMRYQIADQLGLFESAGTN